MLDQKNLRYAALSHGLGLLSKSYILNWAWQLGFCLFQVAMRNAMAQLLGHRNHAEYAIATRMAKSPAKVMSLSFCIFYPICIQTSYRIIRL